jgi:hypothetical protein
MPEWRPYVKNSLSHILIVTALGALIPGVAMAGPTEPGKLRGSISVGATMIGEGQLHGGATTVVPSLTALNPGLPAVPATLEIRGRDYKDVYDTPVEFGVEATYGFSDNVEVFGAINYSKTEGSRIQVGDATVAALNATLPTFGSFGDLENVGLEVGARYFFGTGDYIPFVGASVGVTHQNGMRATFTIPDAPAGGITLADVPFFKKANLFTASVEGGIAANFSETLSGRLSVGARFISAPKGDDSVLGTLGLQSINDGSDRIVFPIKASVAASF